jgi:hypothetical protein
MRRLLYIRLWLIATLIGLWVIGWGSPARTWGSTVTVTDACNDAGGGSQDILSLTATFDAATNMIHVALELCNKPDNQTKYQVLFDHTTPFFETDDRNGDGVVDAKDFCFNTAEAGPQLWRGKTTGPGVIQVDAATIHFSVSVAALNPDLQPGDTIFLWPRRI